MRLFLFVLLLSSVTINAQGDTLLSKEVDNLGSKRRELYKFGIPTILNGSNIDPSPISNINANLTDTRIGIKVGIPTFFREIKEGKEYKLTGFVQPYFKASDGITTLYKATSPAVEFGVTAGAYYVITHKYWVRVVDKQVTNQRTSESFNWLGLVGNLEKNNLVLLYPDLAFDYLKVTERKPNQQIMLSFNRYFYSSLKRHRWKRSIWSIGLGYAEANNYSSLKKSSYETGKLVYNTDSSHYQTVAETTAGRLGPLTSYKGLASYSELYVPLYRNDSANGSVYLGGRISYYGIGNKKKLVNGSTGIYFAFKDRKKHTDIANFAIVGQLNQVNERRKEQYMKNNFSLVLLAAFPLRFN